MTTSAPSMTTLHRILFVVVLTRHACAYSFHSTCRSICSEWHLWARRSAAPMDRSDFTDLSNAWASRAPGTPITAMPMLTTRPEQHMIEHSRGGKEETAGSTLKREYPKPLKVVPTSWEVSLRGNIRAPSGDTNFMAHRTTCRHSSSNGTSNFRWVLMSRMTVSQTCKDSTPLNLFSRTSGLLLMENLINYHAGDSATAVMEKLLVQLRSITPTKLHARVPLTTSEASSRHISFEVPFSDVASMSHILTIRHSISG